MKAREAWFFLIVYKSAYLILIVVNLTLIYVRWGFDHEPYVIALTFLALNLVSWLAFMSGAAWGDYTERMLSVGRMMGIILCATIVFSDIVAWVSPVGASVWQTLMELSSKMGPGTWKDRLTWWVGCAVLLGLENLYFYCLTRATATGATPAT